MKTIKDVDNQRRDIKMKGKCKKQQKKNKQRQRGATGT